MNKLLLINLIAKYLENTMYQRNDNYKTYTIEELIKTCYIYKIKIYTDDING
jgi:hypothetical protein